MDVFKVFGYYILDMAFYIIFLYRRSLFYKSTVSGALVQFQNLVYITRFASSSYLAHCDRNDCQICVDVVTAPPSINVGELN